MVKAANNYGGDYVLYSGLTLYGDALAIVRHFTINFLKEDYQELLFEYKNPVK